MDGGRRNFLMRIQFEGCFTFLSSLRVRMKKSGDRGGYMSFVCYKMIKIDFINNL